MSKNCSVCKRELSRKELALAVEFGESDIICPDCMAYFVEKDNAINKDVKILKMKDILRSTSSSEALKKRAAEKLAVFDLGFKNVLPDSEEISLQGDNSAESDLTRVWLSTTSFIPGYRITKLIAPVAVTSVYGAGMIKSFMSGISAAFGTESRAFSNKFDQIRKNGEADLSSKAIAAGANAVIDIHYSVSNFASDLSGILITGTAVIVQPE